MPTAAIAAVGAPEHLAVAREAVAKSLVLLKNNGSVLPIKAGARVLVTGPGANSMAIQSGGWTISWQGTGCDPRRLPERPDDLGGHGQGSARGGRHRDTVRRRLLQGKPDVAVVVFGEHPYAEFQGDVPTLDYQPAEAKDLATLKKLKAAGIPVVAVFLSGRPMFTNPEINAADAFVAAWLPGSQGAGVADVLVAGKDGKTARGFTGKLPFAWPSDARSPVEKAQFPVGYGLACADKVKVPAARKARPRPRRHIERREFLLGRPRTRAVVALGHRRGRIAAGRIGPGREQPWPAQDALGRRRGAGGWQAASRGAGRRPSI